MCHFGDLPIVPNLHLPSALNSAVQSPCLPNATFLNPPTTGQHYKGFILYIPLPLSLSIPVIIHLFSHVLFILIHVDCKTCFLFSCLRATLCFKRSNIFISLHVKVVSWGAALFWRCGETSFLPHWGSTWFPTLIHLSSTCLPHPATMLRAVYS